MKELIVKLREYQWMIDELRGISERAVIEMRGEILPFCDCWNLMYFEGLFADLKARVELVLKLEEECK